MNLREKERIGERGNLELLVIRSVGGFQVDASGSKKKNEEEDKFRGSPHKSSVAEGRKNKNKTTKKKYKESGRTGGKKK